MSVLDITVNIMDVDERIDIFQNLEEVIFDDAEPMKNGVRVKLCDGREGRTDGRGYSLIKEYWEGTFSFIILMTWLSSKSTEQYDEFVESIRHLCNSE